jgi:hypothetical protein
VFPYGHRPLLETNYCVGKYQTRKMFLLITQIKEKYFMAVIYTIPIPSDTLKDK